MVSATAIKTPNIFGSNSAKGSFGVTKFIIKTAPMHAVVQVKIWLNSRLLMLKSKVTVLKRIAKVKPASRMVMAAEAKTLATVPVNTVPKRKIRLAVTTSKLLIQSKRTVEPCTPVKCPSRKTKP